MKTTVKISTLLAALALAVLIFPPAAKEAVAQGGAHHPSYLRALSDLRLARAYLEKLTPNERIDQDQDRAIHEIELAMNDIKHASIDDGKDLRDHPPIDARIEPRSRFQKAREALNAALEDVSREEDDPHTKGLQERSKQHIHFAGDAVKNIQEHLHLL